MAPAVVAWSCEVSEAADEAARRQPARARLDAVRFKGSQLAFKKPR